MHPIEAYLDAYLHMIGSAWLHIIYGKDCDRPDHVYSRSNLIAALIRDGRVPTDIQLRALLPRLVCRACRQQPTEIHLAERGDTSGWRIHIPPEHWRRGLKPGAPGP